MDKVYKNIKEPVLPNFFVVGAAKAGTTSIYRQLKLHPEIYMSPIKEPHYFSTDILPENFDKDYKKTYPSNLSAYLNGDLAEEILLAYVKNWPDYLKLFKNVVNEKVIGEISNSYLYSETAAAEIKAKIPNAKIIIFLRNPIERAFSHYVMDLRMGLVDCSFREAIETDLSQSAKGWGVSHLYVELGLYYQQVKRYFDLFPSDQILVFLFDDLKNHPETVYEKTQNFLGVKPADSPGFGKKHNQASLPRTGLASFNRFATRFGIRQLANQYLPSRVKNVLKTMVYSKNNCVALMDEDKTFLAPFFKEDLELLSSLIHRKLDIWK